MTDAQFCKSFRFRQLQYNKNHIQECAGAVQHYIICLQCGTVKVCAKGKTFYFAKGDVFYIPQGRKYEASWSPDESGTVRWLSYGFDMIPNKENRRYCLQGISLEGERAAALAQLIQSTAVNALSVGRLYAFWGLACEVMRVSPETSRFARVDKALEYMQSHSSCSVAEVAQYCGISESGLYSIFREKLGKTPVEMKHEILISQAVELLTGTDLSVEEISAKLEFSSTSYFRKVFKAQQGMSPLELRRQRKRIGS